ncbi:hypothetical protein J7W19_11470 [Streptomyces mobaraensis NBRC 13819 = DSM 40847]|uniref:Uncharacterized protein n=1 Tax=Streptomyces mobaraensis (strain ATCC 29032 / DSM 40847 / JCM 4168 / NBRC 13819 / NCIMB 11159 / IPCR 16-22) TaxID=1223523 RepID=M3A0L5_STRM1|nr:hypothetical protein [Streptomyces mobaraensis]EME98593.1 hypothetical protein H340_20563 [Streptomyces mobaraensis NBRC 13819 = DSM 40847]QTT73952.1 hypothetical protein J7W19_11470 [Streptomyces mobaraensis NBRC 13819 = DSM 40847]
MSLITSLARLEALRAGHARPLATVRHRHLSDRPLVLVPLTTAGETGAPLGALVGTDRDAPRLLTVPQPRDRALRFAFLAELAEAVLPYVEGYADDTVAEERKETDPATGRRTTVEAELCADAPQLLVPGPAAVEYVRLLGRSMRFRRTAEEDPAADWPAPPRVPLLGRWLTHYGERARLPGAALLLSMTELLSRHWATGQSHLEDQHLGALLAWIDPPEGSTGPEAARAAELARDADGLLLHPPAGPATDPAFDNKLLAPAIARYDRARTAVLETGRGHAELRAADTAIRTLLLSQLRPTWDAVWRGVDLLRALPEGASVAERWKRDRWSYTGHRDRLRAGEPPQPRRDDAVTAARKLAARETAQARLDAQEALDDPLVMAGRRLAGEAFAGEVTEVVMALSEAKVPRPRPLVTVRTDDAPLLEEGARVHRVLADGRSQPAEFVAAGPAGLTVRLTGGMGRGKVPDEGTVPAPGDRVCWTLFEHAPRGGPELPEPEHTPWTHGGPPGGQAEEPDPVTAEDLL